MSDLAKRKCVPCEGGVPRLTGPEIKALLGQLPGAWLPVDRGRKLTKRFTFSDFAGAIAFVNQMAAIAEKEQHHPDFCLHSYKLLDVTLSTHAVEGLSDNDFILAAKIEKISEKISGKIATGARNGR